MKTIETPSFSNWRLFHRACLTVWLAASLVRLPGLACAADAGLTVSVQTDHPGAEINPAMWGIFFEDINFGGDGGLNSQLVKNGSFEFPDSLMGWNKISKQNEAGSVEVRNEDGFNPNNPHYLRVTSSSEKGFGVSNEGFRGIGVRQGESYDFSAEARSVGDNHPALRVELISPDGSVLASTKVQGFASPWKKCAATLRARATEPKAHINLVVEGNGTLDLDMVSLFPEKTWKNRPGGLRADMVQMLADLKPGFMRFPGGCIVEGSVLERRYQWKTTIGDLADRKLIIDRWNYEFKHKPAPDYFQSFGVGFFEFFQLCEDIGAQPLPILNCGMACQFNSGQLVPLDQLDPYIQDALDLIEFANGPVTSEWGAKRAAMGHPKPFNMKMLGVGNEQWGPQYIERYVIFARALKAKHPDVMLVSAAGPSPADDRFEFLWSKLRAANADIVDEHCYANPIWFLANSHRYDHYDRQGPKVFMGEYGAQSVATVSVANRNDLNCALAEAAYMTGLERNADVVRMASYAPLFANVDAWQWTPDLIWCDNLRVYGTPNYYVQQLFSRNRGDAVLPTEVNDERPDAPSFATIGVGTIDSSAEFKEVRVTGGNGEVVFADNFSTSDAGQWRTTQGGWSVQDGTYKHPEAKGESISLAGHIPSRDYTLTLKARKLSGENGFSVIAYNSDAGMRVQWNVGGSGNKQDAIQSTIGGQDRIISRVSGQIENDRWYDLKLELKGAQLNCYLDGQLVQSAEVPTQRVPYVFATAALDRKQHQVILKVVNAAPRPAQARVNLNGASVSGRGTATVLASPKLADENSFDDPTKVFPVTEPLKLAAPDFQHVFPPYSVTVLRVPIKMAPSGK